MILRIASSKLILFLIFFFIFNRTIYGQLVNKKRCYLYAENLPAFFFGNEVLFLLQSRAYHAHNKMPTTNHPKKIQREKKANVNHQFSESRHHLYRSFGANTRAHLKSNVRQSHTAMVLHLNSFSIAICYVCCYSVGNENVLM